jgi:hypothetical protein
VKIRSVGRNNRKKVFEVGTSTTKLVFPFSKAEPAPTAEDPITELSVDAEAGREVFSYRGFPAGGVVNVGRDRSGYQDLHLCAFGDMAEQHDHYLFGQPKV